MSRETVPRPTESDVTEMKSTVVNTDLNDGLDNTFHERAKIQEIYSWRDLLTRSPIPPPTHEQLKDNAKRYLTDPTKVTLFIGKCLRLFSFIQHNLTALDELNKETFARNSKVTYILKRNTSKVFNTLWNEVQFYLTFSKATLRAVEEISNGPKQFTVKAKSPVLKSFETKLKKHEAYFKDFIGTHESREELLESGEAPSYSVTVLVMQCICNLLTRLPTAPKSLGIFSYSENGQLVNATQGELKDEIFHRLRLQNL